MVAQNMVRTYDLKLVISEKKIRFDDSFDVTNYLQQFEIPNLITMAGRGEYTLTMIRKPEVTPKVLNNSDDMGPGMDISGYCQNNG